jgi:hypothetical protein
MINTGAVTPYLVVSLTFLHTFDIWLILPLLSFLLGFTSKGNHLNIITREKHVHNFGGN